jgi:hypothetical protein
MTKLISDPKIEPIMGDIDDIIYAPEAARLGVRVEDMTEAQKQKAFVNHMLNKRDRWMINRDGVNMGRK